MTYARSKLTNGRFRPALVADSNINLGFAAISPQTTIGNRVAYSVILLQCRLIADFNDHPGLPEALLGIARKYERSRRYEDANNIYQIIVTDYAGNTFALKAQFDIPNLNILSLIESGNETAAHAAIDRLIADFNDNPALPKALYGIAGKYERSRRYEEANNIYQIIVTDYAGNAFALKAQLDIPNLNILSLIQSGNDTAAEAALDKLIADFNETPDLPEAVFVVGEQYYNQAFRCENQGRAAEARDNFQKAIAVLKRIIQKLPTSATTPRACCSVAFCYYHLAEYEKAISYCKKTVDNWPDYSHAWNAQFLIADCYEKLEKEGRISNTDAAVEIRRACEKLLSDYSKCHQAVMSARNILERWD